MTRLSVWSIRLSLVHFALGIALGATMLVAKAGYMDVTMLKHRATHVHLMLFGWLIQLVIGVGYWILPKFSTGSKRGRTELAVASIVALNSGVVVGTFEPWSTWCGVAGWGLEFAAAALFAAHIWPRVRVVNG